MARMECKEVGRWVDKNVQQQVEECVERDCNPWCLCCNKWFCSLIWVVVVVATWVVETVCTLILEVVHLVIDTFVGLADVFIGIFTLDWRRILEGFIEILGACLLFIANVLSIVTLGTLVGAFQEQGERWALRSYVKGLLKEKFNKDLRDRITTALGLDGSGFGLHLPTSVMRMSIRSDFSSREDGRPDLLVWAREDGHDLKALLDMDGGRWRWERNGAVLIADDGAFSEADLDAYLAGKGTKPFTIFSMDRRSMDVRLKCADQHAPEIGLVFHWHRADTPVATGGQLQLNDLAFSLDLPDAPFSRHHIGDDAAAAREELGAPLLVAAFPFRTAHRMGISSAMAGHPCVRGGSREGRGITGAAFKTRWPDVGFKYTAIHELGHTFGLCHVDGLLRIMYTNAPSEDTSWWSGSSMWQYWTTGMEAGFTLSEAKSVWDYIIGNFDPERLATRLT